MNTMTLHLLAALFLPLFPLSMVFNQLFIRLRHPFIRSSLIVLWPQIGLLIAAQSDYPPPDWFVAWALFTAIFYAYRAIAVNEAGLWIGFVATSAWSLIWLFDGNVSLLRLQAFGFSAPLLMMVLLTGGIERRFGAVHTRLGLGLANNTPRYAALFVIAILATVATPLFPSFFTMLSTILTHAGIAEGSLPVASLVLALIWILWTWSGARLLKGIVVGERQEQDVEDMSALVAWIYAIGFLMLAGIGLQLAGVLL